MLKKIKYTLNFLIGFVLMASFVHAKVDARSKELLIKEVDALVNKYYEKGKFGGNVYISVKDEVLYNKSFGFQNESKGIELTEDSIFPLASISKQFTAMGILMLAVEGKLDLDDPLSKYLPGFDDFPDTITIHNMLIHASGLRNLIPYKESRAWYKENNITGGYNYKLEKIMASQDLLFKAGTEARYCNSGYTLMANIITKVSGQNYAEFIKERIFDPLKMESSYSNTGSKRGKRHKNEAYGYRFDKKTGEKKTYVYKSTGVGQGGVFSTVHDLEKWNKALYTDKLVPKEYIDKMFTPYILKEKKNDEVKHYGYGFWIIDHRKLGKISEHSGGNGGFKNYITRFMDEDALIVLLGNINHKPTREIIRKELIEILSGAL